MSDDCISRQAAEELFRNARKELFRQYQKDHNSIKDMNTRDLMLLNAEQMIHLLPTIQPVTGKWIYEQEKEGLGNCRCSNCDRWYYTSNKIQWNFCPNCGCRMVEQKESEEV